MSKLAVRLRNSTIVRTFAMLERVSPALGGRWAEALWFSVPAGRRIQRRVPAPDRTFALNTAVGRIAGDRWGNGNGRIVYLLHGWAGQRSDLDALVAPLVDAGHDVVTLDAPSHGDSGPGPDGPKRGSIPQFAAALAAVVAAEGPAYAVIAHSLGAVATMHAVADGTPVERLAFIAPMGDPLTYTYEFARRLGFGDRIRRQLVDRIEARFSRPMSHFSLAGRAGELSPRPRLLVAHDRGDRETQWSDSAAFTADWPGATLVTTTGLGHRRILRDPSTVTAAVTFVVEAPADQPSW